MKINSINRLRSYLRRKPSIKDYIGIVSIITLLFPLSYSISLGAVDWRLQIVARNRSSYVPISAGPFRRRFSVVCRRIWLGGMGTHEVVFDLQGHRGLESALQKGATRNYRNRNRAEIKKDTITALRLYSRSGSAYESCIYKLVVVVFWRVPRWKFINGIPSIRMAGLGLMRAAANALCFFRDH